MGLGLALSGTASAAAEASARDLVEIVDVDGLSVSPDGTTGVFRTVQGDLGSNSYRLRWHSVDLRTGAVRDIASGGRPIYLDPGSVEPEEALWVNRGRSIVYRALVDGAIGLWMADVDGSRVRPLVVRDEDVAGYSLSQDGRSLLYTTGASRLQIRRAEESEYDSGILVDSSIDLAQNLFRGGSVNGRAASQRLVGYWYVRDGLLWRAPRQDHAFNLATGADEEVGPKKAVGPFEHPAPRPGHEARNASGDIARSSWNGRQGSLSVVMGDGSRRSCADRLCTTQRISALAWRPGSSELLVTFIDPDRRQALYLWQASTGSLRRVAGADGLLSGGRRSMIPCAVARAAVLCVESGPASPPRLVRIDLATGELHVLFDPNVGLRQRYAPRVRYLRWAIGDGRLAAGILLRPRGGGEGPAPLYVNYYSCEGFLRGGEGDEWPIPELLDAGFAVACINAVPSTGPQDALFEYRTGLAAVRTLVDMLAGEGLVDRSKVAMGGLSFGSEVAMWIATHSELLAAVSIASAQLEPASYWMSSMPGSDQPGLLRKVWRIGAPDETPAQWRRASPALNSSRVRVPILFQLPEQEARRIPELYARLAQSGVPTELYAFPDEAHLKVQPRHRLAVYARNLDWFRYWLQDYQDPDPSKAGQYARWGLLKAKWASRPRRTAATGATTRARPAR